MPASLATQPDGLETGGTVPFQWTGFAALPQRSRLFLLAVAAALPILIFSIALVILFDRQQQRSVEQILRQNARSMLAAVDREIANHIATLEALAASPSIEAGDMPAFYGHAERVLGARKDWLTIRLIDARTRRPVADVVTPPGRTPLPAFERGSIDAILRNRRPLVGPLHRPASGSAQPFVIVHVPVLRDGAVLHVLSAAVKARTLSRVLLDHGIGQGWVGTVLDQNNRIIGRTRRQDDFVGMASTHSPFSDATGTEENLLFTMTKEGEKVYTAFRRSPFSGWTVAVGAPAHVIEGSLRRSLLAIVGGGSAALLIAISLAALLTHNIASRQEAERRLAAVEAEQAAERRLADIAANFPGVIYRRVLRPDGSVFYPYASHAVESLVGLRPADVKDPLSIEEFARRHIHPEDAPRWREAIRASARTLAPYDLEGRIIDAQGRTRWLRTVTRAHRGADGSVIWDGVVLEITDLKQAEEALRQREEHLRLALRGAQAGAWVWDMVQDRLVWSEEVYDIYGLDPKQTTPSLAARLTRIDPEDWPKIQQALRHTLAERRRDYQSEYRIRHPKRGLRWLLTTGQVTYGRNGRPTRLSGITMDVTERKQAEEHQKLLMAELNHRVKNTLAVVQSIAAQTLRRTTSLEGFAESFNGRLRALATAHSLLTRGNWRSAGLEKLVQEALKAHGTGRGAFETRGPELDLSPKQTLALSLVLHELATNAAKYGALSRRSGRVDIHWEILAENGSGTLRLGWVERGGPPVKQPQAKGFGTTLIQRSVSYDLDGAFEVAYEPDGLRCEIVIPWARGPAQVSV